MLLELAATVSLMWGHAISSQDDLEYVPKAAARVEQSVSSGFYAAGEVELGEGRILGQGISDLTTVAAGVGYRYSFRDDLTVSVEIGAGYPFNHATQLIEQEVIYTYLVGRHHVDDTRPPPVADIIVPYGPGTYATTWDLEYAGYIKAGVEFQATDHIVVSLSYRYFKPDALMEIYEPAWREAGGGWWQEYRGFDMSAVRVGLGWRF